MNGVEMSQADQMSGQLSGLDQFRQKFARMLIHFIWVNVFLVMGTAWWVGYVSLVAVCGAALLLGVAATGTWIKFGAGVETRLATSMSLAGLVALFVAALATPDGQITYQLDAHMYFFAVLAFWSIPTSPSVRKAGLLRIHPVGGAWASCGIRRIIIWVACAPSRVRRSSDPDQGR